VVLPVALVNSLQSARLCMYSGLWCTLIAQLDSSLANSQYVYVLLDVGQWPGLPSRGRSVAGVRVLWVCWGRGSVMSV